jgi:5-methylcytosine-specific restriction endonuclease McrBC GTP-binding regulatory subunit McrB
VADECATRIDNPQHWSIGAGIDPKSAAASAYSRVSIGISLHQFEFASFYTSLQAKAFVVLSGLSGIGKTKLIQFFVTLLPEPSTITDNHLFLSVRPDWRDSKALLGYYNPLTESYAWTPFLRFLERAARSYEQRDGLAWFVVLDEMNLAHVEYYFADLLSVMESGRDEEGWTREALTLVYPETAEGGLPAREMRLPPNLYVVGTVNIDETTHAFSPKVLDRAFSIELVDVDFSDYPPATSGEATELADAERQALLRAFTRNGRFPRIDKAEIAAYVAEHPEVRDRLQALNMTLRQDNLHFGYRVFDEIVTFLAVAEENGMFDDLGDNAAFDAAVLMKVLPKFHGSRGKLQRPLEAVLAWCADPDQPQAATAPSVELATLAVLIADYALPKTAERVQRMLAELQTDGFTAFG